jgi:hypothetical protein
MVDQHDPIISPRPQRQMRTFLAGATRGNYATTQAEHMAHLFGDPLASVSWASQHYRVSLAMDWTFYLG